MEVRTQIWKPDTCDCVFETKYTYQHENAEPVESFHKYHKKCSEHSHLSDQAAADVAKEKNISHNLAKKQEQMNNATLIITERQQKIAFNGIIFSFESIAYNYERIINTLASFNSENVQSQIGKEYKTRILIISDIWSIIDQAYSAIRVMNTLIETIPEPRSSQIQENIIAPIEAYKNAYKKNVDLLRNFTDHLSQNVDRTHQMLLPGVVSFVLHPPENEPHEKMVVLIAAARFATDPEYILPLLPKGAVIPMNTSVPVSNISLSGIGIDLRTIVFSIEDLCVDSEKLKELLLKNIYIEEYIEISACGMNLTLNGNSSSSHQKLSDNFDIVVGK